MQTHDPLLHASSGAGTHNFWVMQVAADNVIYPGTPEYLAYVDSSAGRYSTRLRAAKFEYDQFWRPGWTSKEDAVSFSVKL
jgi:hypothetical protein